MEITTTLLFTLLAAVVLAAVFSVRRARERARRQAMQDLAHRLSMTYSGEDESGLLAQLKDFKLFNRERRWLGRKGRIRHVVRGKVEDTDLYMFDYSYLVSSGKSSRWITQTIFFANNKNWYLPNFKLQPETWWQKALAMFDKSDINFPENPEFSGRFWLTSEFESLTRKAFHPDIQQFLLERPPAHLEGNNFYLLAYKPRKALNADEAEVFFGHCCQLVSLLKKKEGQLELLNLAELQPEREKEALRGDDLSA